MNKVIGIVVALLFVLQLANGQTRVNDIKLTVRDVFETCDKMPHLAGGTTEGLREYFKKNFIYPKDAWDFYSKIVGAPFEYASVSFVVCKDGRLRDITVRDSVPASLADNIRNALGKMDNWIPGTINGEKVNTLQTCAVPLYDSKVQLPYNLEPQLSKVLNKAHWGNECLTTAMANEKLSELRKIVEWCPQNLRITMPYVSILSACGEKSDAYMILDYGVNTLTTKYYNEVQATASHNRIYESRLAIAGALMRALMYEDLNGKKTQEGLDFVSQIIVETLKEGDISKRMTDSQREQSEEITRKLNLDQANFAYGTQVDPRTEVWETANRWGTRIENSNDNVSYWVRRGYNVAARGVQNMALIKKEREKLATGKISGKHIERLFGIQAFVIRMQEGDAAEDAYINGIINNDSTNRKVKNYLGGLKKRRAVNAAFLSDRSKIKKVLLNYAPIADATASAKQAPKDEISEFWKCRDALCDVYPLRWLME